MAAWLLSDRWLLGGHFRDHDDWAAATFRQHIGRRSHAFPKPRGAGQSPANDGSLLVPFRVSLGARWNGMRNGSLGGASLPRFVQRGVAVVMQRNKRIQLRNRVFVRLHSLWGRG